MRKFRIWKLLPVLALLLVLLTTGVTADETSFDKENFVGLVLRNTETSTVTVKLYSGFKIDSANLQTPVYTEGGDQYYTVQPNTRYYCVAKPTTGYARYNDQRCIYITEAEAAQKTVMDVTPNKRSTNGWDSPSAMLYYTEETMTNIYKSSPDLWPQYAEMFTTPAFQSGRNQHRQTTQTEMMNYINALDKADDKMHVYILGKSNGAKDSEKFDIPLVLFTTTDLSGADTLEEAAALVRANGKLTVHYQAQIHGDEPAACEAALGMIKRFNGAYGESLLDSMNIYVIPRLNPWGAYKSNRMSYLNGTTVDPNRDFLHLYTPEVQARMVAYNLFEPDVVFDNHEYQVTTNYNRVKFKDMSICTHPLFTFTQDYQNTAVAIAQAAFAQLEKDGLTYTWYSDSVGGLGGNTGSSNTAFRGAIHVLMETDGCDRGLQFYERRVATHASALGGILAYLDQNAQAVKATVKNQRDLLVEKGRTYSEEDQLVFSYSSVDRSDLAVKGRYILLDSGTIETKVSTFTPSYPTNITKSRTAPTAYVIPADASFTQTVLELMDKQGISYDFIPAGYSVMLQQYTLVSVSEEDGIITEAGLTNEKSVTFPDGAYAFTMDQVDREILACLMEPDMNIVRSQRGSLVQQGVITVSGGMYPIYRYIRDLNADGTITYTEPGEVPEGPEEPVIPETPAKPYTIYLDGIYGSSEATGYSEKTAVNTLELAHKKLDALMADAPAGTTGTIIILGTYTISGTKNTVYLPSHDYPLLITGGTLIYKDASGNKHLCLGGDTTFDDITLKVGSDSDSYFLFAMGHKLVIGENVTCEPYSGKTSDQYFAIAGGNNGTVDKTDMTILSGYWFTVYAGGRNGKITGDCRLEMANCSVARVTTSRACNIQGNVYISLENMTARSNIYCGNYNSENVDGNVTLVLGQGVNAASVFAGSGSAGNVSGTVTVIADGVDLTAVTLKGKANNTTGTIGGLKLVLNKGQLADALSFLTRDGVEVVLGCDQTKAVTIPYDTNLDLQGHNASNVTVADGKTMTVKDTGDSLGILSATGTVVAAEGYEEKVVTGGKSYPEKSALVPGDMDGNGQKNTEDAVYLLLHVLFGENQYPIDSAADCDMNGDSKVDTEDAVYLLLNVLFGEAQYPI